MDQIRIVREEKGFLVVYKPAGIAVQSAKIGEMDLEHWLLRKLAEERKAERPYLSVIHRLDQPVEGLIVFATDKKTAGILSGQMQKGRMHKEYLAVTDGAPPKEKGRLEDLLLRDGKTNTSRVVQPGTPGARQAVLEYECLQKRESGRTLVKIRLLTGRHHQIRVQLAHAGMPIAGDRKYNPQFRPGEGSIGLCAWTLSFFHPATGKSLRFQSAPQGKLFQIFDLPLD